MVGVFLLVNESITVGQIPPTSHVNALVPAVVINAVHATLSGKTSYFLSRVRVVHDHRLGSISCGDEQPVMGVIDRHVTALPSGRPGVQHLMIDGVKDIDSATF